MALINLTGPFGIMFTYITLNITGTEFLTNLLIIAALFLIGSMFNMPSEMIITGLFPVVLVLMAASVSWVTVGGTFILYLAFIFVTFWPLD